MTTTTHSIDIIINAIDKSSSIFAKTWNNIGSSATSLQGITSPLAALSDSALLTEAAIVSLGVAFLGVATNEAAKFDLKIREIGSLVNATPEQVANLKKSVQNFALTSVSNFDAITAAAYKSTSGFGSLEKTMAALEAAEKGSIVGATTLDSTMSALSKTMNAYGLSTGDVSTVSKNANDVMATLFTTVQNGDLNMTELAGNIGQIVAVAAASKVPLETVGAAIAALTVAGIGPAETMTKLTQLFRDLQNPSDKLKEALGGISLATDGLPAVMARLKEATGGSAEKVNQLFSSTESAGGAIVLINDSAGKFSSTLEAMKDKTNTFNKNLDAMSGGLLQSEQKFENAGRVLLQKLGDPLERGSAELVDSLANVFKGITIAFDDGAFKTVYAAIKIGGKTITDALDLIAKNIPAALEKVDFDNLIKAFDGVGDSFSGLFTGIDLETPEGLADAIQLVINSITSLTNFVKGIVNSWGPAVNVMKDMIENINDMDPSTLFDSGKIAGFASVLDKVLDVADKLAGAGEGLHTLVTAGVFASLASTMSTWVTSMGLTTVAGAELAAGLAAIVFAAKALEFAITSNVNAYDELQARNKMVSDAQEGLAKTSAGVTGKLSLISEQTKINIKDMADFNAKVESGAIVFDNVSGKWESSAQHLQRISKETGLTVKSTDELNKAMESGLIIFDKTTGKYSTHDKQIDNLADKTQKASLANGSWVESVNKAAQGMNLIDSKGERLVGTFGSLESAERGASATLEEGYKSSIHYEDGVYKLTKTVNDSAKKHEELKAAVEDTTKSNVRGSAEWKNVQDAMQSYTDSANEFKLKAAELTEKKFEAILTATVDLKVAEVEAQTKQIEAAFESLNKGIESTGDTLAGLADTLAQNVNPNNNDFLRNLASEENGRRNQEFDLQKELINNQVENLKLKNERLKKGDALIQISSDGLAPELDSLFDVILKRVQIKASEEGMNLLLGLSAD